jgi:hypothetical protein
MTLHFSSRNKSTIFHDYSILNLTWFARLVCVALSSDPVVILEPEDNGIVICCALLFVDTTFTLRVGRYKAMRDKMIVAATAKSMRPSKSIQIHGATEFHRLNNEQVLWNHRRIVRRLAVMIVQLYIFDSWEVIWYSVFPLQ